MNAAENFFSYRENNLFCEGVAVRAIAEKAGTPLYVYSGSHVASRFAEFERALDAYSHLTCYAVTANSNLSVLRLLARRNAGFDIVSGGELFRVLQAGGKPAQVVFSGVGKTAAEIDY